MRPSKGKTPGYFQQKQFARSGLDTCLLFCAGLTRSKNVSGWQNEGECREASSGLSHSSHLSVKQEQSSLGMLLFFSWMWTLIFCIQSKTITSKWFWCTALCFLAFTPLFPALCCCFKPIIAQCCVSGLCACTCMILTTQLWVFMLVERPQGRAWTH